MTTPSEHEIESVAFETKPDRGYTAKASYLKDPNKGDALIEVFKGDERVRHFLWPAYKVWNISAHFSQIVDGEIKNHDGGYRGAGWDGITPNGAPQKFDQLTRGEATDADAE